MRKKQKKRTHPYELVTQVILDALHEGSVPWRQTWATTGLPQGVAGHRYRGINALVTQVVAWRSGYEDPRWITFKRAKELGAHVRKGEKSTPVIYWGWTMGKRGEGESETSDAEDREGQARCFTRSYRVFNVAQVEGLDLAPLNEGEPVPTLEACEALIASYRGGAPTIQAGRPAYAPKHDAVFMPSRGAFESAEAYYATLFHELAHSTGHETRLARPGVTDRTAFASHAYGKEELVAELCAAFLCSRAKIAPQTEDNAVAYLDHWIRAIEGDPSMLVGAAQHAQRAADWIMDECPAREGSHDAAA